MDVHGRTADEWQSILDSELAKSCEEMNTQLIDLCVSSLLEFKGIPDTWTEKQNTINYEEIKKESLIVNRRVNLRRLRVVFVAAAILATLILGAVTLTASGFDWQAWVDSWLLSKEIPEPGDSVDFNDDDYNYTAIQMGERTIFADNEEMKKIVPCIIPSYLPEKLIKIVISDMPENNHVLLTFDNAKLSIIAFIDIKYTDYDNFTSIIINDNEWHLQNVIDPLINSDIWIAIGYVDGVQYQIEYPDKDEIIRIIESMEDY